MQLFPVASQMFETDRNAFSSQESGDGFGGIFASYIEEGRYDYTGRPNGFSAYGPESGTIDRETGSALGSELRKRNVREETVDKLETLLASDSPATIGTIFASLSGKGRYTEKMDDEDAANFKSVLGKLGFNKEEQDELMALSDDGDAAAMWERITAKLDTLEGSVELTKGEWAALLKGFDTSKAAMTGLMSFFAANDDLSLSGADLKTMLTGVKVEISERQAAARHAQEEMREAMTQALAASKTKQQSEPVNDMRGTRRSEQSEALMHDSVRKNTGSDELKRDNDKNAETEAETGTEEHFENRKDGKNRSERILATNENTENTGKSNTGAKTAETPQPKVFANVTAAPDMQAASQTRQTAGTANTAQNYRQEIFSQVEQGMLQSALNGGQRLTLQLNPGELGQVTVMLSVHQGEVKATIRAENQDSADVLRAQLAELKTSLEAEGLKVKELDVQTGLSEQSLADRWDSHREHNLMRDASERDRLMRLTRIRREAADGAEGKTQLEHTPVRSGAAGLHVVA